MCVCDFGLLDSIQAPMLFLNKCLNDNHAIDKGRARVLK